MNATEIIIALTSGLENIKANVEEDIKIVEKDINAPLTDREKTIFRLSYIKANARVNNMILNLPNL